MYVSDYFAGKQSMNKGGLERYLLESHHEAILWLLEKQQAVDMAKQGQITGIGIAHRGDTEYLKSIPDGGENNNLSNLPSVSPET